MILVTLWEYVVLAMRNIWDYQEVGQLLKDRRIHHIKQLILEALLVFGPRLTIKTCAIQIKHSKVMVFARAVVISAISNFRHRSETTQRTYL
jgi:hypothetical protein